MVSMVHISNVTANISILKVHINIKSRHIYTFLNGDSLVPFFLREVQFAIKWEVILNLCLHGV